MEDTREVCGTAAPGPLITKTTPGKGATTTPPPSARKPVRMCVRCAQVTTTPITVSEVHQASGPGFNVYACPTCAPHFPPLPDALDLLATGWRRREGDEQ